MPELPDITVYVERLTATVVNHTPEAVVVHNPFVLRSVEPPLSAFTGRPIVGVHRLGKRIVLVFESEHFLVLHLMIAGRLRWRAPGKRIAGKLALASLTFPHGTLYLTEAGTKRRASLHAVQGHEALQRFDRGGLEPMTCSVAEFGNMLRSENHTIKRSLTDPRLMSGIGNAYSDEMLHAAQLSPMVLTSKLTDDQIARLHGAMQATLASWTDRLRVEAGEAFPETVTAFHDAMAVHGRYGKPCPVCGAPVQRIRYADNETNYCARCQTGGRVLADRALSRLLKGDFPRTLDELAD
ncbi:MAG TPA: DNA-formamidopyrimidine glycosylase family protein [Gemmatimonas sp.]|uniref:Fpg/Nei family DNA glycosylase n=1 Tax=Gemmatimonas sp. TaxID=1962908 RepID=UPI002ED941BE